MNLDPEFRLAIVVLGEPPLERGGVAEGADHGGIDDYRHAEKRSEAVRTRQSMAGAVKGEGGIAIPPYAMAAARLRSFWTVFQLRAVFVTPRPLSKRSASFEVPNPKGVWR